MADVTDQPMPTYRAVCDLYEGKPGALWDVGLGILSRAAFIGAGIYVVGGERDLARVAQLAIAGSLGVEAFVVGYVWIESGELQYEPKLL